jgi:uncharacterized protein YjcR
MEKTEESIDLDTELKTNVVENEETNEEKKQEKEKKGKSETVEEKMKTPHNTIHKLECINEELMILIRGMMNGIVAKNTELSELDKEIEKLKIENEKLKQELVEKNEIISHYSLVTNDIEQHTDVVPVISISNWDIIKEKDTLNN